ncbi:copper homeostasis protein CutC [Georgenia satyanarayanai]|uniref:copper homeostasis protein CutC n=1 Tax=Georgenia satyanarayanai TaxID=860221 RepID=UPI00126542FC|nr:copper homeostasis protein CutC [Georgenia satyanarayanai]
MTQVEICLEDVGGPASARAGGAGRVELCAGLSEGGTTPTLGFVTHARRAAPELDIQVLVRPRAGDFVYSAAELDVMVADIEAVLALPATGTGVLGFTLGALTAAGTVDEAATARLVTACSGAPVTFHKAFDAVPDKRAALDLLTALGVAKVLTAGGPGAALGHLDVLADLVDHAGQDISVVVGGGVRPGNAAQVVRETGAREIHLRAPVEVRTGSAAGPSDYDVGTRTVTSAELVAAVVAAVAPGEGSA